MKKLIAGPFGASSGFQHMQTEIHEHPLDNAPMLLVKAGRFLMGQPSRNFLAEEHELPLREVHISAFWIDVYPITNRRFELFLKAGGYDEPRWWNPAGWEWRVRDGVKMPVMWGKSGWDGPDQPVAGVSWYEADAYARWTGRRLPTDAEWEKAARGTDGRQYPWGNEWPTSQVANFDMQVGRTTPVGLYPDGASPYGCQDMAGNVNNWTQDWYWPFFGQFCVMRSMFRDPKLDDMYRMHLDPEGITEKVDRGGGFATKRECQEVLGCSRKVHWPPEAREPWNGFRTAMDHGQNRP